VDNWNSGGKVSLVRHCLSCRRSNRIRQAFLDYAHILTRLPELQASLDDVDAIPDASQASELEDLTRSIPRLIDTLPDVLRDRDDPRHNVALAEMIAELMLKLDKVNPLALVRIDPLATRLL
jgi:nuclear pore complex protein Nup98-Nup96